jgi:hypothetical protein
MVCFKRLKMRNLKKTLNRVFNEQAKAYIVTPCCEALKNLKYDNHKSLFDEIRDYDLADPEQWASFKARYFITLLEDVMVSYCQCLRSPQNAASWRCLQEIEEFFEKGLLGKPPSNFSEREKTFYETFYFALSTTFDFFKNVANSFIEALSLPPIGQSNNNNFIRDFCDRHDSITSNYIPDERYDLIAVITDEMVEESDYELREVTERFLSIMPYVRGAEEAQIADCEVSPQNPSVLQWAASLLVPAATVASAIALHRITRGRSAKACTPSGKANEVRVLSGLLCAAVAGSATQNAPAQETCDAVAEQIVNDECSPNPSLCEPPSGGGGSQPPGGGVEPPGGGGGVTGGDGML